MTWSWSSSEKARKQDQGIISESQPRVQKRESEIDNSDFRYYYKSQGKPVHVDVDGEIAERCGKDQSYLYYQTDWNKNKPTTLVRKEIRNGFTCVRR